MSGKPILTGILLVVALAVGFLAFRTYIRLGNENASLRRDLTALRLELEAAKEAQGRLKKKYRSLVQDLWRPDMAMLESSRENPESNGEAGTRAPRPKQEGKAGQFTLDFETMKSIWQEGKQPEIVTPETINATLSRHDRGPEYLVAASLFTDNLNTALGFLEEALNKKPDFAPALSEWISRSIESGYTGISVLQRIQDLKRVSPSNSLPHYYASYCYIQNGDVEGFLGELREGSSKNYYSDYMAASMPFRRAFYREAGASDSVSEILSAVPPQFTAATIMEAIGNQAALSIRELYEGEAYDDALTIAKDALHLGNKLSASSRYLTQDLVGMAIQDSVLREQRAVYMALEDLDRVDQIDLQLLHNEERIEQARRLAVRLREQFRGMNEKDLLAYTRLVLAEGEISAAANLLRR